MIKGVNKLIVDVANPDSEFFERAIFFVKPQMKDTPPKELNKSADALILTQSGSKSCVGRGKMQKVLSGVAFVCAAGLGAAISALLIMLLS